MQPFDNQKIAELLEQNKIEEVKDYINQYFFNMGSDYFFKNYQKELCNETGRVKGYVETYDYLDFLKICKIVPDDLDNLKFLRDNKFKLCDDNKFSVRKYLKSSQFINLKNQTTRILDFNLPRGINLIEGDKYLNMIKPLGIEEKNDFQPETFKKEINLINNHLYEVLCSKDKYQYEYLLNFISFSSKAVKVKSAIYFESMEQTGKGIYFNFINRILGDRMLKTSSVETITKYTQSLEGRTLVNFDEVPSSGKYDIADRMKSYITEPTFDCRSMYSQGYTQKNTFNVIITSNNNAINFTSSNNVRYASFDVSHHRKGDRVYFDKLIKAMNKKGVKEAYYKFLLNHYEDNKDFDFTVLPNSKSRNLKISCAMPKLMKIIKNDYVLKRKPLNIETKELLRIYNEETNYKMSSEKLGAEMLNSLGIKKKRVYNKATKERPYFFIMDYDKLYETFKKREWIVEEFDEFEDADQPIKKVIDTNQQVEKLENILTDKEKQINELQKQIEELQKQITKPKTPPKKKEKKTKKEAPKTKTKLTKIKKNLTQNDLKMLKMANINVDLLNEDDSDDSDNEPLNEKVKVINKVVKNKEDLLIHFD
ncbi:MAG: hypothetical protein GY738_17865 [Pseudoalteromonas sp.]|nr:hypothetical protein [Pseudoalteromonas sp.]